MLAFSFLFQVSNYARRHADLAMRSQHNQIYWHGKPYAAYGNGAASFVNAVRASSNLVTLDLVFVNVCFQRQAHDCKYCPCCPKFSVQSLSVYEVIQFAISNVHDLKLHIFSWSRYVSMIVMWFGIPWPFWFQRLLRTTRVRCLLRLDPQWCTRVKPGAGHLATWQLGWCHAPQSSNEEKGWKRESMDSKFMTFWFKLFLFMMDYEAFLL